jgi:hypothetical protein
MAAAEQKKSYAVIKNFLGINTKANRTAIDEKEFAWIENAMPIGFGNIKVVPAQSAVQDSTANAVVFGNTVTHITSANIDLNDYILVFSANGASQFFDLTSDTKGNVATSGTFSGGDINTAQYKNERVIIADPERGLYNWNGTSLVSGNSVGFIGITNPGAGYTQAPVVTISAPNEANGVQALAEATITTAAGGVRAITVDTPGSGYTSVPLVTISAPDVPGSITARATAALASGNVVSVTITETGSGYIKTPTVTITGGGGSSANAVATISTGQVTSIFLTEAGSGYTSPPTVTIQAAPAGGTNATAISQLTTFKKGTVSVIVTNGGTGYSNAANVVVTIGNATGYTTQANATAIVSGNTVNQIIMTNPGAGYTATSNVVVTITGGGGSNAAAKAIVNTDDVQDIATFGGRVWVASGRTLYYSAADSATDFTSVSAGSLTLSDSTLRGNIKAIISANNFLYIFGETSINIISDLRVTPEGTTLFTNTNVSASIGTGRTDAIFPYFRSLLFMNDYGMYALVGSTTSKLSDSLDGIFPNIDFSMPITGGQVLVNNILCAAFNFTYNDPTTNPVTTRQVQAVFFDKKWFITSQGSIDFVASVPVEGTIKLFGVDNTDLYQLYGNDTSPINMTIRTALMPLGDPIRTKQALKFGIEATLETSATLNVTVDSESGSSPLYTLENSGVTWINNQNQVIPWINNSSQTINWLLSAGYFLYKSDAQQYGKYLGLTLTSNAAAFTVNTFEMEHELRVRF